RSRRPAARRPSDAGDRLGRRSRPLPGGAGGDAMIRPLVLAFALYLAVPLWDVPLIGLSWSAPLLALIAVEMGLSARGRLPGNVRLRWILLAAAFWFGCALSWTAASLGVEFAGGGFGPVVLLLRFLYWSAAFLLVAALFTSEDLA